MRSKRPKATVYRNAKDVFDGPSITRREADSDEILNHFRAGLVPNAVISRTTALGSTIEAALTHIRTLGAQHPEQYIRTHGHLIKIDRDDRGRLRMTATVLKEEP